MGVSLYLIVPNHISEVKINSINIYEHSATNIGRAGRGS
jgi:hypothetical protein